MPSKECGTDTTTYEKATAVFFSAAMVVSVVAVGFAFVPTTSTASSIESNSVDNIVSTTAHAATSTTIREAEEGDSIFNVSNLTLGVDTAAALDDTLAITARVKNTGDAKGTQTVEYRIGDNVVASQNVMLGAGNSTTVEFEDLNVSDLDTGEYEHGVFTSDDSQTADLRLDAAGDDSVVVDRVDSDDDDDNESEIEQSGDGGDGPTNDGAAGLGALAAFVALIAVALLLTRPNE